MGGEAVSEGRTPVTALCPSGYTRRALGRAGIEYVDELQGKSEAELESIKGIGAGAAKELAALLAGEPPPKKKQKVSKPKPQPEPEVNRLLWRCDKYPSHRVFVGEWAIDQSNEVLWERATEREKYLAQMPYCQFRGCHFNLKEYARQRKLTPEEMEVVAAALDNARWVYREYPVGPLRCGGCSAEFTSAKDLRFHEQLVHGEELNLVRARREVM